MEKAEDLPIIDAEFTEEEEEALDTETAITPYERLETWQGILSDPAKAIRAFGGIAIDALAIQFDDGRGKKHFALTAEGAKAVLAKSERPYRIHKPEFEEFVIDGAPWVRCIATVTLLDNGTEVADISERPRKSDYGKLDKFAGRSAFTSALARVARTICAGTVGMLEAFFTTCMNEGKVIVPGEAPDAIRNEVNRAQAGRAEERMGETPRIGPEKARELQNRLGALYKTDPVRFANLSRELERLKKRLCKAAVKLERLPAEHLETVEEWLSDLEAGAVQVTGSDEMPPEREVEPEAVPELPEETQSEGDGEEPFPDAPAPVPTPAPAQEEETVDLQAVLAAAVAGATDRGFSAEQILGLKNLAGLTRGEATEEKVADFVRRVKGAKKGSGPAIGP